MDDTWQCDVCGSRNPPGTARCYSCGTPRLIPPTPGTRVYDSPPRRRRTRPGSGTLEANKALVRRLFALADARDYEAIDPLASPDFVNHADGDARGVEAWTDVFKSIGASFPDARYTVEDLIAEGDKVVAVATMRGTYTTSAFRPLRDVAPTGKTVEWGFIHIFRIADGRLAEHWARRNDLEVMRSLSAER